MGFQVWVADGDQPRPLRIVLTYGNEPGQQRARTRRLRQSGVDMVQSTLEVDVSFEVIERLSVFAGLRYNDLFVEIDTSGPLGRRSAETDEDWTDPVIGAHHPMPFAHAWPFTVRGDIGGFGVGSNFAWLGTARSQCATKPLTTVQLAQCVRGEPQCRPVWPGSSMESDNSELAIPGGLCTGRQRITRSGC